MHTGVRKTSTSKFSSASQLRAWHSVRLQLAVGHEALQSDVTPEAQRCDGGAGIAALNMRPGSRICQELNYLSLAGRAAQARANLTSLADALSYWTASLDLSKYILRLSHINRRAVFEQLREESTRRSGWWSETKGADV